MLCSILHHVLFVPYVSINLAKVKYRKVKVSVQLELLVHQLYGHKSLNLIAYCKHTRNLEVYTAWEQG